ncbi:hypothetical protein B0T24DRAFT_626733 [Lasiosphaeria ovina]|uniref:Uncharacterized protein n=1 Tax=Lasiosphaeria ovina TaxID=92902 RepID=A0AAE0KE31_9PEZI|nr:hypothetical protein B0T24DRAFT_626733 [Lasiosphaeria ovina]
MLMVTMSTHTLLHQLWAFLSPKYSSAFFIVINYVIVIPPTLSTLAMPPSFLVPLRVHFYFPGSVSINPGSPPPILKR